MTLSKTGATTASGYPIYYDSGNYYDDGKYYDRWYSTDGVLSQVEEPDVTTKDENVIIYGKERTPKIIRVK